MELPIFAGEDAHRWIVRIDRFFKVNGIRDEEKMDLVILAWKVRHLTGSSGGRIKLLSLVGDDSRKP